MASFYKKLQISLVLLLGSCSMLCAQTILRTQADKAMQQWDYKSAIVLYQRYLSNHPDETETLAKLADCYRLINDPEQAERWYAEVVKDPKCKPINKLYYGMMLQANNRCDLAKSWFAEYSRERPEDTRGTHLAQNCDQQEVLRTKSKTSYVVSKISVNSNRDDFSPAILGNRLVFASDRDPGGPIKRTNAWTGSAFCELYAIPFDRDTSHFGVFAWGKMEKFSNNINSKFHEAAVSFTPDTQTIFFTRNSYLNGRSAKSDDGQIKLKIYSAKMNDKASWSDLHPLPFCSDEYNVAHPAVSPDGQRLFFSSNKPGGYGGMDLYVSFLENGRWGIPMNLGPEVNTTGNEVFPYVSRDERLYFASNGHIGLGGLDIYYTSPKGKTAWNSPVNIGAPINSNRDDFGICFGAEGDWGFFTSGREGGVGRDDLYAFKKGAVTVEILITSALSQKPLSGASLQVKQTGLVMNTGVDGRVVFDMPLNECMDYVFSRKDFENIQGQVCSSNVPNGSTIKLDKVMERVSNNYLVGLVFDMMDGLPAEGVVVNLTNDCNKPEASFITGADGRYRFKLDKNCCYKVRASGDGYIADAIEGNCTLNLKPDDEIRADLSLQPYRDADGFVVSPSENDTNSRPVYNDLSGLYEYPDGTPATIDFGDGLVIRKGVMFDNGEMTMPSREGWQRGKSGDGFLVNLYYDYDQSNFRSESLPALERLRAMLLDNPDLQIEIASHTDNRGPEDYNLSLSQKRADVVVDWLSQRGILRDRLVSTGYGESMPVAKCNSCSEKEHQLNRRSEFKVIGRIQMSDKKEKCKGCPF